MDKEICILFTDENTEKMMYGHTDVIYSNTKNAKGFLAEINYEKYFKAMEFLLENAKSYDYIHIGLVEVGSRHGIVWDIKDGVQYLTRYDNEEDACREILRIYKENYVKEGE